VAKNKKLSEAYTKAVIATTAIETGMTRTESAVYIVSVIDVDIRRVLT
jgi:hypothetical protein